MIIGYITTYIIHIVISYDYPDLIYLDSKAYNRYGIFLMYLS